MTMTGAYQLSVKILNDFIEDAKKYGRTKALKRYNKSRLKLFYKIKQEYERQHDAKNDGIYNINIDNLNK